MASQSSRERISPPRGLPPRRHRLIRSALIFFAIVIVGIIAIVSLSPSPTVTTTISGGSSTTTVTTAVPATTSTTLALPGTVQGANLYGVQNDTMSISEANTNLCVPNGQGGTICGPRTITVGVYYPYIANAANQTPYRVSDRLPLVLFAPGYKEPYTTYLPLINSLVSDGFVVAGINFPLNTPSSPGGPNEADIVNQPGDMTYALTQLINDEQSPTSALYGLFDPSKVVASGQSDGGDTVLALADNSCCRDKRIAAVIVFSGAELGTYNGTYFAGTTIPILIIQGTNDTINIPSDSDQIYSGANTPKYYLHLVGADHLTPYTSNDQYFQVVNSVSADFIDGYLLGQSSAIAKMLTDGNVSGVASIDHNP
ncbi:MAG: hypothetical protein M0T78_01375 [Actinomycetota bacterium]|nr:hypothetical protein [Actinomycetota bacterium]